MTKNEGGRPRMPPGVARTRRLGVPLRPREDEEIRRAAKAAGVPVAEWARGKLVEAARPE